MPLENCYEDAIRAAAYAKLEFPGTYYLAYRDLPELIARHAAGRRALDFGCGSGRSTRFLRSLGFEAAGVDVSEDMLANARAIDPGGDYRLIEKGGLAQLPRGGYDLVLSAFTFDNVPMPDKPPLLRDIAARLAPRGVFVNLVSSPDIYVNEWASFSTRAYPENRDARCGDRVRIVITDIADGRPVEDVVCPDDDYRRLYAEAGLVEIARHAPLGRTDEPIAWVNETRVAPWVVWVLKRA